MGGEARWPRRHRGGANRWTSISASEGFVLRPLPQASTQAFKHGHSGLSPSSQERLSASPGSSTRLTSDPGSEERGAQASQDREAWTNRGSGHESIVGSQTARGAAPAPPV